jgi:hypothetical protein
LSRIIVPMTNNNNTAEIDTAANAVDIKTTIKKNDWGEWVVRLFIDGKHQKAADYFTNDREDATITATAMVNEVKAGKEADALNSIDLTPTWEYAVSIYIEVLQNPDATAGAIIGAKEELLRLARNFEAAKAHVGKLQEALDEATNPQPKEK